MSSRVKSMYRHPEIEQSSDHNTLKAVLKKHASSVQTSVDVLEIGSDLHGGKVSHKNLLDLSHEKLVLYLEVSCVV